MQHLRQAAPCNELKSLHGLIKDKFFKMVNVAFIPIPTNAEYYFCRYFNATKPESRLHTSNNTNSNNNNNNVSDDDISNPPSEREFCVHSDGFNILQRMESGINDVITGDICPLFLHLVCTLRHNGQVCNTPVRLLPTCLGKF